MTSPKWLKHLIGCQRKGYEAFKAGYKKTDCPYRVFNHYHTGGKNLTRQRMEYWLYGWEMAAKGE